MVCVLQELAQPSDIPRTPPKDRALSELSDLEKAPEKMTVWDFGSSLEKLSRANMSPPGWYTQRFLSLTAEECDEATAQDLATSFYHMVRLGVNISQNSKAMGILTSSLEKRLDEVPL